MIEAKDKLFYKIVKPPIKLLFKILFRPQVEGLENIQKDIGCNLE